MHDAVLKEIIEASEFILPSFLETKGLNVQEHWLLTAIKLWTEELEMPPGCIVIWLDEFLTTQREADILIALLRCASGVSISTMNFQYYKLEMFIKGAMHASITDGKDVARIEWRNE